MIKTTILELRQHIAAALEESVNFWGDYHYNKSTDRVEDLVKGALRWYHFDKPTQGWKSPSDPRFTNKLRGRMKMFGIGDHIIDDTIAMLNDAHPPVA